VKRNIIVIAVVVATLSLLVWAGIENYHLRQLAEQQEREHQAQRMELVPVGPEISDSQTATTSDADDETPDLSGKPAPEFSLATPDGTKITLSALRKQHKAVMVNFWATWCVPCKVEMPWLVELQKQYASQGLQIVGVSEDDPPDAADKAKEYAAKVGVEYPIVIDDGSAVKHYGVQDFPTSFYIASDGAVAAQSVGLVPRDQVEASIRKALAGGK
jgi:thiol-disulfide isomerase/thioredoxin